MINPVTCEECGADMKPDFYEGRCVMWGCPDCGWRSAATGRERLITLETWHEPKGQGSPDD